MTPGECPVFFCEVVSSEIVNLINDEFQWTSYKMLKNNIWKKKKAPPWRCFNRPNPCVDHGFVECGAPQCQRKPGVLLIGLGVANPEKEKRHVSPPHVSKSFLSIIDHPYFHTRHVDMIENFKKMMRLLWMYPLFLQAPPSVPSTKNE